MTIGLLQFAGGDPWQSLDGRLSAPSGTPQYSSLLNGYGTSGGTAGRYRWPTGTISGTANLAEDFQPQWEVVGVDFPAGIDRSLYPTNASLSDPNNLSISGVTVTKSTANGGSSDIGNYLTVSGDNVIIEGFDFSLHGGWQIDVTGSNCTITNNYFEVQTTAQIPIFFDTTAVGGTATKNEINGNSGVKPIAASSGLLVIIGNGGNFIVQYNYIHDCYSDGIDPGGANATMGFDCRFNLLVNMGAGSDDLAHPDFIQAQAASGGTTTFSEWRVEFNTLYQPSAPTEGGTQGITIFQHSPSYPIFVNPSCQYNTIIALNPGTMPSADEDVNPFISMEQTCIQGVGVVDYNYSDTSGNLTTNNDAGLWLVTDNGGGGQSGTVTIGSNNKSMIGKTLVNLGSGNYQYQ